MKPGQVIETSIHQSKMVFRENPQNIFRSSEAAVGSTLAMPTTVVGSSGMATGQTKSSEEVEMNDMKVTSVIMNSAIINSVYDIWTNVRLDAYLYSYVNN